MQTEVSRKLFEATFPIAKVDAEMVYWNEKAGRYSSHAARVPDFANLAEDLTEKLAVWEAGRGVPKLKLDIEGSPSDGYSVYWTNDADGEHPNFGDRHDHPFAAADWCERNGFAWEVLHLAEGTDPLAELAAWRAAQ